MNVWNSERIDEELKHIEDRLEVVEIARMYVDDCAMHQQLDHIASRLRRQHRQFTDLKSQAQRLEARS
jgi:hypothetical protein